MSLSLTLVHEATHAILDLQKASFYRWEHELIAYLAEAWCKISGGFRERPLVIQDRAAALAHHIMVDKAGRDVHQAGRLRRYRRLPEPQERNHQSPSKGMEPHLPG